MAYWSLDNQHNKMIMSNCSLNLRATEFNQSLSTEYNLSNEPSESKMTNRYIAFRVKDDQSLHSFQRVEDSQS